MSLKSATEFYKSKSTKDGYIHKCKDCDKKWQASTRRKKGAIPLDKLLRPSYRDGRWGDVVASLKRRTSESEDGCWVWEKTLSDDGYGHVGLAVGHTVIAHRLMYRAANGGIRMEPFETIHHICNRRACVNPLHLQLISNRENVAEMHERKYYIGKISKLEEALRQLDPTHPYLT